MWVGLTFAFSKLGRSGPNKFAWQGDAGARRAESDVAADGHVIVTGPNQVTLPTEKVPVKAERAADGIVQMAIPGGGASRAEHPMNGRGGTPPGDVVSALIFLRANVTVSLEAERTRLYMSSCEIGKTVKSIRGRLFAERDRLKFIERKVGEKSDSHNRAAKEFVRAREVLEAAKFDEEPPATHAEKKAIKTFIWVCEKLVQSWHNNCGAASSRLQAWEFKLQRQTERVTEVAEELAAAEAASKEKNRHIDMNLKHLKALHTYLATL